MQSIFDRLKDQLIKKGMNKREARETATRTLQNSGSLYRGTETLTPKGIKRTNMGAAGRAIDRAAKLSGRSKDDYVYSSKTNRATLKDKS